MRIQAEELSAVFPANYLARGRHYHLQERVLAVEPRGDVLYAEVQGGEPEPYYCEIDLSRDARGRLAVRGHCTCPVGFNCKHVVAALLAWGEQEPAAGEDDLPPELSAWLRRLQGATGNRSTPTPAAAETLLYQLELNRNAHGGPQLWVRPLRARLLKAGGYGRGSAFTTQEGPFLQTVDYGLLGRIRAPGSVAALHPLPDEGGADLLRELIATGRCHWESIHGPPLQEAEARAGEFDWQLCEDGRQALTLKVGDELPVMPLAPPWYVEPDSGRCGPVTTPHPPAVALALLRAPAVPHREAIRLSERLQKMAAHLPLPLELEECNDLEPIPWLRLESLPLAEVFAEKTGGGMPPRKLLKAMNYSDEEWLHRAQLQFDYAGVRVSAGDRRDRLVARQGNTVQTLRRQHMREQQLSEQLGGSGLQPFGESGYVLPSPEAWTTFMREQLPRLRERGWRVEIDPHFQYQLAEADDWFAEVEEQGQDWFGLDLGVMVDGERISLLPLLANMLQRLPPLESLSDEQPLLVPLEDGRLLPLPVGRVRPILETLFEFYQTDRLDAAGQLKLSRLESQALAGLDAAAPWHWSGGEALIKLGERLSDFAGIEPVTPPAGLNATLRDYQQTGLNWLQFLRGFDLAGVLADDMGLGKTVQTLAHLLLEKESGRADRPSLVVLPTSLISNWRREAARLTPDLRVLTLHGPQRQEVFAQIPEHDLVLTTYPLLGRDAEELQEYEFHFVVLDEAQNIKNPRAKAAIAARTLQARHRLCLTGTPLENNLGELWSLFHFLMPGLLGEREHFRRVFRTPIEKYDDAGRRDQLRRRVAPFLLRRTKEAVATELPGKTELIRSVGLADQQRDLYETVRLAMHERIQGEIARKGLNRSHIVILDALLKLRQICCDPRLVKLESAARVRDSAKLELLLDMLPELVAEGRRILLFSQFTSMLELIEEAVTAAGIDYVKLTGQTKDRATPVERFQAGEVPLFLISLKAGGTGLNLTAADTVIHYDPWWNPAVERQATDRAYRIGQDKPVFVYKLIAEGTVEEKMAALQERKSALSNAFLDRGEAAPELTAEDLAGLFEPLA